MKTLSNTSEKEAKTAIKDVQFVGDGDAWILLSKAWSESERWMKSSKALSIENLGCVVQVTTQQGDQVSEAVCFVPGVEIVPDKNGGKKLVPIVR